MTAPISVVVCTRTRPELLDACLALLLASDAPTLQVVIVDNTVKGDLARKIPPDARVRVIREPRPGLSRARNTGIRSARHDIIAFIDDDVVVDAGWLPALAASFDDASIAGVTGLVVAAELETEAQREFERYGGMGKGGERRMIRGADLSNRDAIRAQAVGVGANMAFRRDVFGSVGMFDEALGAGTSALGGEDLDFFHRVLRAGLTICYEPTVKVSHRHRRTVRELRAQIFANGCAYAVYLRKIWSHRTVPRRSVSALAIGWLAERLATALFRTVARPGLRCLVAWDEVRGAIHARTVHMPKKRGGPLKPAP